MTGSGSRTGTMLPFLLVFLLYALLRVLSAPPALESPREHADTAIYQRISRGPILGPHFLEVDRPFVFPLLLKAVDQDFEAAARWQLGMSLCAWGALAFSVSAALRFGWLKWISFLVLLALSLVRHLAGWDFVMLTESLSLSFFVLFLAAGLWLLQGWRTQRVILLSLTALGFAFTRDTNAYLLLILAGMLAAAALLHWAHPRTLILVVVFAGLFLLNNANADRSRRWVFPLINVLGKRILPFQAEVRAMQACGMPLTPRLLSLADSFANAQERAFFNDPELEGFRTWVSGQGKACYIRWLLAAPLERSAEVLARFDELIYFENVNWFFSRRYSDLLPSRLERLLYPVHHVTWIWAGLTLAAGWAVGTRAWRAQPAWAAFILLSLTLFPHLFITWHGDAMAPERHALAVGLQLALSLWLLVFLLLERAGLKTLSTARGDD